MSDSQLESGPRANEPFAGKTVLVTGGASGIGRAAAQLFANRGARTIVADINATAGQKAVASIRAAGRHASFVATDVSCPDSVHAMMDHVLAETGRLDAAFNNAGILGTTNIPFHEYPDEQWDKVITANLKGVWLCMKAEIRQMLQQDGGAIVNMSSVSGTTGFGPVAYVASKHGVIGLTKKAAAEYGNRSIRVNCVCPAIVRTPLSEDSVLNIAGSEEAFAARHPLKRLGTPQEIAEAAVWLCGDSASFVTGHAMSVDGGWTAP